MRHYEVVVIFQPEMDETAVADLLERVKGWITESGGVIAKVDNWGKRRLAYLIRKQREGQYYLIHAEMSPDAVTAVSYTHLRAHETPEHLVCRLLLEKKKNIHA